MGNTGITDRGNRATSIVVTILVLLISFFGDVNGVAAQQNEGPDRLANPRLPLVAPPETPLSEPKLGRVPSPPAPAEVARAASTNEIPAATRSRLRALESNFDALAARGGSAIGEGIITFLSAGVSIGLGVWLYQNTDEALIPTYLFIVGGANVIRGVLDITLHPNPDPIAVEFSHTPAETPRQAREKLAYGEATLEDMATRTKIVRLLDSGLSFLAGTAIIPIYLLQNDRELQVPDYFVLAGAGISGLSGLIGMFTTSDTERRWDAYQEMKMRMESRSTFRIQPMVFPLPGGAVAGMRGEF